MDEDDLLQECKNQNTRLIDYFQRVDVLKRLFGYVAGEIEAEENVKFKYVFTILPRFASCSLLCRYPYVATEVLCSDIWSIVETCLDKSEQLLVPFWNSVLDREPDLMKTQNVMASQFAKINATYLSKKPAEVLAVLSHDRELFRRILTLSVVHMQMLAFIQSQPHVVERILRHIETPSFVDLLVRIIQLDEYPTGSGVLEVCVASFSLYGRVP